MYSLAKISGCNITASLVPRVVPLGATPAEPPPDAANTSPCPRLRRRCQSAPPEAQVGARKAAAGLLPKLWSTVAARASLGSSTAAAPARIRHSRGRICAELRRESCCNSWSRGDRGERRVCEVAAWLGRIWWAHATRPSREGSGSPSSGSGHPAAAAAAAHTDPAGARRCWRRCGRCGVGRRWRAGAARLQGSLFRLCWTWATPAKAMSDLPASRRRRLRAPFSSLEALSWCFPSPAGL